MAGSLNKVMIIGNLGRDPEVRMTQGGGKVATVNVATSESWMNKQSGVREEKTEWHRMVIFGKGAETVERFLKKGSKAYFEGRLQTRKWNDKETNQERYTTEIVIDNFTMLDRREGGGGRDEYDDDHGGGNNTGNSSNYKPNAGAPRKISSDAPFDDDIPF